MKLEFGGLEKKNMGFKVSPSDEEIVAAKEAARKIIAETQRKQELEKPQKEREAEALRRIKENLSEETTYIIKSKEKERKQDPGRATTLH